MKEGRTPFAKPIPGQSLTRKPRNAPWERPPKINDPEKAMDMYMKHLSKPEVMQAAMDALEMGLTIKDITEGITRSAVAEGIHTVDISLIAAPVVHEMVKSTADLMDVEYEEGFVDKKKIEKGQKARIKAKANMMYKKLKDAPESPSEPSGEPVEAPEVPTPQKGLMARPEASQRVEES